MIFVAKLKVVMIANLDYKLEDYLVSDMKALLVNISKVKLM